MKKELIIKKLNEKKTRSAWDKGVKAYAIELLEDPEELPENADECYIVLLNGAHDWKQYSWGGCSLCYDFQIAKRLCTPSELKKTHNGERRPNSREEWLDVQARALFQASRMIWVIIWKNMED